MIPPMMILCALRVSLKKTTYDMGICCGKWRRASEYGSQTEKK